MNKILKFPFLTLLASALLFFLSCSKSTSTIRVQVYFLEAETNIKTVATNVVVKLSNDGNETQSGTTSNDGTVTFQKLEKSDNWSLSSRLTLNGINYSGTITGIKTDGRTGVATELILRN